MTNRISLEQARRIALAAQGFGRARPEKANWAHLGYTLRRLGLFQIDSVNVLVRAHYLPAFSRLGPYDRGLIDRAAWGAKRERRLFEYWAHEASLLPLDMHPLLRWRMAEAERGEIGWPSLKAFSRERRAEADAIVERLRGEGPLAASDFEGGKGKSGWWEWGDTKRGLEWLFWSGRITTATRRASFERVYDLSERVLPAAVQALPTPAPADAQRALVLKAASAMGIATEAELRDYFRLRPGPARRAVAELVEEGRLVRAEVAGLRGVHYLDPVAARPRRIRGDALLAPFDPLIWERGRAERLFGFHYRIGIYTPAEKRVHGYYVLPFLMDGALVARVDLKADRKASRLLVPTTTLEPGAPPGTLERLDVELASMARWLGLEEVAKP